MSVTAEDLAVLFGLLSTFCLLFAVAGLVGRRLGHVADRQTRPVPTVHVRPVVLGTCQGCGSEGVPVERVPAHPLMDPEPHCQPCRTGVPA